MLANEWRRYFLLAVSFVGLRNDGFVSERSGDGAESIKQVPGDFKLHEYTLGIIEKWFKQAKNAIATNDTQYKASICNGL